jgi:hypothetical protein
MILRTALGVILILCHIHNSNSALFSYCNYCITNSLDFTDSRDYQTIYPGKISYFTRNSNNQIFHIGIDSFYVNDDEQITVIPNRNILETSHLCYTPNKSSWIGKKIIFCPDGTNLFLNKVSDTIYIKTDAGVNEEWIAFTELGVKEIIAKVVTHDTLTFLGLVDSVKTIEFTVYDTKQNLVEHDINTMSIKLSKRFGLVKTLNFHFFPDYNSERTEWAEEDHLEEFSLIGLSDPASGVQNLSTRDIYDFDPEDELHTYYDDYTYGPYCLTQRIIQKTIYTVLSRFNFYDTIIYEVGRKADRYTSIVYTDSSSAIFYNDTIKWIIKPNPILDKMPGEPVDYYYTYSTAMWNSDPVIKTIPDQTSYYELINDSCWEISTGWFGGCYYNEKYIEGLGGPYYECTLFDNVECGGHLKNNLVYYKKGDKTWGTPLSLKLGINKYINQPLEVYPNPAQDIVLVNTDNYIGKNCLIRIYDMTGRLVLTRFFEEVSGKIEADLRSLPPGYYVLYINNNRRTKLIKQ